MKTHCIRLTKGQDLLEQINNLCIKKNILAGVVISSVGSVTQAVIRDASGITARRLNERMEIISLNGTLSIDRVHLHIAFSKKDLSVVGGHLMKGCIINTTCELVILEFTELVFKGIKDETTGYDELDIIEEIESFG